LKLEADILGKVEIIFSHVQEVSSQVEASPRNIQGSLEQVVTCVQSGLQNDEEEKQTAILLQVMSHNWRKLKKMLMKPHERDGICWNSKEFEELASLFNSYLMVLLRRK
jgi:uncharacterized protein YoxC